MLYQRPLAEKTLERLYKEAELSTAKRDFLHQFFLACNNLYGAIELKYMWEILKEIEATPRITRKELINFAKIVRREDQPYHILELSELFSAEEDDDLYMFLVSKKMIGYGHFKFNMFYQLMEERDNRPFYIPEDFLSFANPKRTKAEKQLYNYIKNLRSTANKCVNRRGEEKPNKNKGKKLGSFSYLTSRERSNIEVYSGSGYKNYYRKLHSGIVAEKLMRNLELDLLIGYRNFNTIIDYLIQDLEETGVEITIPMLEKLSRLITNYNNSLHMWCTSGWSPTESAKTFRREGPTTIEFGPGYQKAFADGTLDKNELIKIAEEYGITVKI